MLDVLFGDVISGDRKKKSTCVLHYKEILFCNDTQLQRESKLLFWKLDFASCIHRLHGHCPWAGEEF